MDRTDAELLAEAIDAELLAEVISAAEPEARQIMADYKRRQVEQLAMILSNTRQDGVEGEWARRLYAAGVRVRFTESKRSL